MSIDERDYDIAQLEAELHESRFKKWDVETFLADRHRAKIEALTTTDSQSRWPARWQAAKEISSLIFSYIGMWAVATAIGYWLLTGEFFIHSHG